MQLLAGRVCRSAAPRPGRPSADRVVGVSWELMSLRLTRAHPRSFLTWELGRYVTKERRRADVTRRLSPRPGGQLLGSAQLWLVHSGWHFLQLFPPSTSLLSTRTVSPVKAGPVMFFFRSSQRFAQSRVHRWGSLSHGGRRPGCHRPGPVRVNRVTWWKSPVTDEPH